MGLFNPKWRRKLDVLTSLATIKIGVGIACIGALGGTIAHELDYYKRKKD